MICWVWLKVVMGILSDVALWDKKRWIYRRIDYLNEWMNRWMDEWMDRWMDGWMDGRMDR